MIRGLLRLVVLVVVIVGLLAFFLGYRWGGDGEGPAERPIGTIGRDADGVDTGRARETGAEVGQRVATGADRAQRVLSDASLTTKIKAKMALDDGVRAANIDIDTKESVVTLTGQVSSEDARMRAMQLAQETEGVRSVVDRLTVATTR